jgi:hypothetical protein
MARAQSRKTVLSVDTRYSLAAKVSSLQQTHSAWGAVTPRHLGRVPELAIKSHYSIDKLKHLFVAHLAQRSCDTALCQWAPQK